MLFYSYHYADKYRFVISDVFLLCPFRAWLILFLSFFQGRCPRLIYFTPSEYYCEKLCLVNKNHLLPVHFGWQDEYIAVSISHSAINRVREYIKNQEEHHRKQTFEEEYQLFIEKYGFEIIGSTRG